MKRNCLTANLAGAAGVLLLAGCTTPEGYPDRTASGALIGAGAGAASGAVIAGHHEAGEGALIGGAVGAATGGLMGHAMDEDEQARLQARAPQTYTRIDQGQPLGVADVKAMARSGISDEVIISQIRNTHTAYHLTAAEIIDLHDSGVSEKVIAFMINTADNALASPPPGSVTVVNQPPPPRPVETVLVAPGPGYVWVDGDWLWRGRWVWVGGYWTLPPHPHAFWVRERWWHDHRGWHHAPGHWR